MVALIRFTWIPLLTPFSGFYLQNYHRFLLTNLLSYIDTLQDNIKWIPLFNFHCCLRLNSRFFFSKKSLICIGFRAHSNSFSKRVTQHHHIMASKTRGSHRCKDVLFLWGRIFAAFICPLRLYLEHCCDFGRSREYSELQLEIYLTL